MRKGDWIQTFSGRQFWPLDPKPEDFDVVDIAHALGQLCRFNGHCVRFYSVAEHSVHIARQAPASLKLTALLHDAAEAYLADVPRPVKRFLVGYADLEHGIEQALAIRYGLSWPWAAEIRELDNRMLATEKAQAMAPEPAPWAPSGEPLTVELEFWPSWRADVRFRDMAKVLLNGTA